MASRNTILWSARMWKDPARRRSGERDQGGLLLRRRSLSNVQMAWRIREECFPTLREGEREFRERSARNRIHRRDRLPYGSSRRYSRWRRVCPVSVPQGNGWIDVDEYT